jgi:hypothetical protein
MQLNLPIQAVVDRSVPLQRFVVDTPVVDPQTGTLLAILKNPVGGVHGPDPNDPMGFSSAVNPRLAVCQILSGYAIPRCLLGGGYFSR